MSWSRACTAVSWLIMLAVVAIVAVPRLEAEPLVIAIMLIIALLSLVCASIVAWRLPSHPAGSLLAGNGAAALALIAAGDTDGTALAGIWMLLYVFLAELLLVMPTGRLPRQARRLWVTIAIALPVIVAAFIAVNAYMWLIRAEPMPSVVLSLALVLAYFACLVASVVALPTRYHESGAQGRLGLRWMFFAGAAVPLTLVLCWASFLVLSTPELVGFGLLAMHVAIPVATTIALVRPGWFDIDEATVAATTVTALSVGVLVAVSIGNAIAGLALVTWSPIVGTLTTLVLGILAIPLYRTLRRVIARSLYPGRERALTALHALRTQMETGQRMPEDIEHVLQSALRDPGLRVAYRRIGDAAHVTLSGEFISWPAEAPNTQVRFLGEDIGTILPSTANTATVPSAVCTAVAPILDAVRLRAELRHAMQDVAASRRRLVLTGYEERRRLERDLHDGAQQRLVALGMRLRVLQRTVSQTDKLTESLDAAVAELATAVAELRQLAHGVRPSALDDGLMSALAELRSRAPNAIDLDVDVDNVPDAVATTAYFVASEAITNAIKHAQATGTAEGLVDSVP